MFLVKLLKIAKPITSIVAGYSTGVVVKNLISATTPSDLGKYQSMAVKAGGFFVGGAVGGVIGDRVEKQFDNAIKVVEGVAELDPIQKFEQFAETLSEDDQKKLAKYFVGIIVPEDEKEED